MSGMKSLPSETRKLMGTGLVILQFGLLALQIFLALFKGPYNPVPMGAWLLVGAAIALACWTLMHNRLGNFHIRPTPKVSGILVTSGPYRWIRHPMYTTLLLGAGALAWISHPVTGWATWSALAGVLFLKSVLEEHWLCEHYPEYAAYRLASKRFLPYLF